MESLIESMGRCLQEGKLPASVPASRRLEHCLFPVRRHPRIAALDKQLLQGEWGNRYGSAWAQDLQLMGSTGHDEAGLAAYCWPNSTDDERLITLLKFMHWIFLVDDALDGLSGVQADQFCNRLIHETFSAAGRPADQNGRRRRGSPGGGGGGGGGEEPQLVHEKEPLIIAVGLEWWNEMQDGMSKSSSSPAAAQSARFSAYFTNFLLDQARFTHFREKLLMRMMISAADDDCNYSMSSTTSTTREVQLEGLMEEYFWIRRLSSGFDLCTKLIEYELGMELDEGILRSPLLLGLHEAVCDHVCWLNDIVSFPKEFVNGDVLLNLLPLLHMRNNNMNLQQSSAAAAAATQVPFDRALSQAWEMTRKREEDCARLAQQLLLEQKYVASGGGGGGGGAGRDLEMYVETVCGITSGNWAWTVQSPRYELPAAELSPYYSCTASLNPPAATASINTRNRRPAAVPRHGIPCTRPKAAKATPIVPRRAVLITEVRGSKASILALNITMGGPILAPTATKL